MNATMQKSTERPKVSVIMIAYNQERYIGEAIRSVVAQKTEFAYELIVADDASTDSTADIARQWQKRYPDIIRLVVRGDNLGLQANFLDAYSRCRGTYIAICEADDFWCSPHKLSRQSRFLDANPDFSLCFHRVVNYYEDNRSMSLSNPGTPATLQLEDLARANVITNLSVMYRALKPSELPGWIGEIRLFDYAMHSLHASKGKIGFIPRPMAVYRRHSRGIWSGDSMRAWMLALDVREHLITHFADSHPEAVANYGTAYHEIAAAIAAECRIKGNDDGGHDIMNRAIAFLKLHGIAADEKRFENAVARRIEQASTGKKALPRIMTALRESVSRLIPVPRIRGHF